MKSILLDPKYSPKPRADHNEGLNTPATHWLGGNSVRNMFSKRHLRRESCVPQNYDIEIGVDGVNPQTQFPHPNIQYPERALKSRFDDNGLPVPNMIETEKQACNSKSSTSIQKEGNSSITPVEDPSDILQTFSDMTFDCIDKIDACLNWDRALVPDSVISDDDSDSVISELSFK